jgi:putative membrane protein
VIFALLLVLLLLVIVSLALDAYHRSQPAAGRSQTATGALALLDLRYARGEVDRDAYLQARADLSGAEAATLVMPAPSEPPEQPSG